jgi:hypothetical protein
MCYPMPNRSSLSELAPPVLTVPDAASVAAGAVTLDECSSVNRRLDAPELHLPESDQPEL